MCNREAFDEIYGAAGWALQRLGRTPVERIQIQSVRQIKLKFDFTETVTETDSHKAKQKHLNHIHILAYFSHRTCRNKSHGQ